LSKPKIELRVLLDEGVHVGVADTFRRYGHIPILQKEVARLGSPDPVVWTAAIANQAILIAYDKDVKVLRSRADREDRFKRLSLISFRRIPEPMAAKRLSGCMSFIEHEWQFACEKTARRLMVEIYLHQLRTFR
jgi:hypothetical protein